MLAGIVIAVLVLLASQAAAVESCPGVFRDVVLGVPGDEVSRVSVVIRSGIVVLQQQNQSSTNVTVLLRSSATDAELLEAAIGTAQFTDGIIVIKGVCFQFPPHCLSNSDHDSILPHSALERGRIRTASAPR